MAASMSGYLDILLHLQASLRALRIIPKNYSFGLIFFHFSTNDISSK